MPDVTIDDALLERAYKLRGLLIDDPRRDEPYIAGVHDAIAWLLGEYDEPELLPADLLAIAQA